MIHARVGLQQRILPAYRAPFFEMLATACLQGLSVFAGEPKPDEAVVTADKLNIAQYTHAHNQSYLSGAAYFYWQAGIMQWLRSWQPDVLIIELNPRNRSNPQAVSWMKRHRKPVIGWGLGISAGNAIEQAIYRSTVHQCSAVIAYSPHAAQQYMSVGMEPARVFIAKNAVAPRPRNLPIIRPAHFHNGRAELLYVGRLQPRKRVETLLRALEMIQIDPQPHLTIVGDGPDRARLEALASLIYPQADFVGAQHDEKLTPYYNAADLFILPGTGGLAIQQAMAHALPVIVGEADGTQGELVREENGWLLPDDSPQTLAQAIGNALADIERLRLMGLASQRIVAEEINLEAMVQTFTRAIESVLGKHARRVV